MPQEKYTKLSKETCDRLAVAIDRFCQEHHKDKKFIAGRIGISQNSITALLAGKNSGKKCLHKLCKLLGEKLGDLVEGPDGAQYSEPPIVKRSEFKNGYNKGIKEGCDLGDKFPTLLKILRSHRIILSDLGLDQGPVDELIELIITKHFQAGHLTEDQALEKIKYICGRVPKMAPRDEAEERIEMQLIYGRDRVAGFVTEKISTGEKPRWKTEKL